MGARVGTSSLRRSAQLLHARPDIIIEPLRGNLDTRLKKLQTQDLDAIVLAAAGILRLGISDCITEFLDEAVMLPAVGQGALCLECRKEDPNINTLLKALNHEDTRTVVFGERAFLNQLGGGCQVPIAAHGRLDEGLFSLTGLVASVDGKTMLKNCINGPQSQSVEMGKTLGEQLLNLGAEEIIDSLKENFNQNENR